jgi:hypothetical protein
MDKNIMSRKIFEKTWQLDIEFNYQENLQEMFEGTSISFYSNDEEIDIFYVFAGLTPITIGDYIGLQAHVPTAEFPSGEIKWSLEVFENGKSNAILVDNGTFILDGESRSLTPKELEAIGQKNTKNGLFPALSIANKDLTKSRLKICGECPELIKPTWTCKKCGCFMKVKTKLENVVCPLGKW